MPLKYLKWKNEGAEQFEHKVECDLQTDLRNGATRQQDTVDHLGGRASGSQESK